MLADARVSSEQRDPSVVVDVSTERVQLPVLPEGLFGEGQDGARRDLLVGTLARHAPELRVTGISAGGHALVRLPAAKHSEADVVTGAAEHGIALTGLAHYCHGHDQEAAAQHGPALVIGYATPVGHSHRAAITALGHYLASTA